MKWNRGESSEDIEDRRDQGGGGGGFGGPRVGIGGLILLGVLSFVFKRDLISPFLGSAEAPIASTADPGRTQAEQPQVEFVTFVLNDVQRTMERTVPNYRRAKLVLFRDGTQSGCGAADSAMGPFYCPADEKVYIDLGFYDELKRRFGAPGQFAQAYVLAHEVGHHIQKLMGIESQVRRLQQENPSRENALSVRMELQADCFAGVWGHSTAERNLLEQGDVESGLGAAAAVGDDRIQQMSGSRVSPERFTHGSAAQRVQWFQTGLKSGSLEACNTFAR
ncbi:MAG: zinc metallopeptidase [Bryobacteraceae bacterium]|nr:zinc metallopeptidase [Bryobacteraceae bacterium]